MPDIAVMRDVYRTYLLSRRIENQPEGLYHPVNYIMNLGGKHIRATFLLLGYTLYQQEVSDVAKSSAYAMELFHNFSLVHDDIMDNADTRRGQPSVHTAFGINSGILSGDAMLILVYEELLKIPDPNARHQALTLFTKTAKEVCEGQQYDIDFESREDVSIEDYLLMIKLKTAVLLACSLQVGAILGGAPQEDAERLYAFGIHIGLSFQIQDDLLDTYGEKAKVGKMIGGDIQQRKKTILYLTALQNLKDNKASFKVLYNSNLPIEDKLPKVIDMMDSCDTKQKITNLKDTYLKSALEELDKVDAPHFSVKKELEELAKFIIQRVQ